MILRNKNTRTICLLLLLAAAGQGWSQEFDIRDFGASGDGNAMNTSAIQSAIDACHEAGGGKVIIPPGTYLSGTIILKSHVELHFMQNATLLGSPSQDDYPIQPVPEYRSLRDQNGHRALIYARKAENIALTGRGTIDGQGQNQEYVPGNDLRSRNIMFISCRDIRVEGLHINNSAFWNQQYLNCEDVMVSRISVYNHCNRNNDAIDIDGCRRFVVSDCIFDTDDDGLTLKSTGPAITEDVVITNCIVSSYCNAIKAGTESSGGFRNITISNCVVKPSRAEEEPYFNSPEIGITGLSLMIVDGGTMEGISVNNLTIYGTMAPIYIRLGNRARAYSEGVPTPDVGSVENLSLNNITIYGAGSWGSSITGIPGHPVRNITLNNIQHFTGGGVGTGDFTEEVDEADKKYPQPTVWKNLPAQGFYIRHAENVKLDNMLFGVDEPDVRPPVVAEDVKGLAVTGSAVTGPFTSPYFLKGSSLSDYRVEKPAGWKGGAETYLLVTD